MPLDNKTFKQVPASVLNRIDNIGVIGLRLLFYYESFINRTDDITKQFAFPAIETTSKALGLNKNTVIKYNEILESQNLLKVTKHKLEYVDEYTSLDEPIGFIKYHNHYNVLVNNLS
jgi:DNA-binding transcriptional regulator YhcF (GntR family)